MILLVTRVNCQLTAVTLIAMRSHKSATQPFPFSWKMNLCLLLLMCAATAMAQKDLTVDCDSDTVAVSWKPRLGVSEELHLSRALLGNCPPSFVGPGETLRFYVLLRDCGFRKQVRLKQCDELWVIFKDSWMNALDSCRSVLLCKVTVNGVTYSSVLIYDRGSGLPFISQSVQCVYDLPLDKVTEGEEQPGAGEEQPGAGEEQPGAGEVVFSMVLMNSDFSGPAPSLTFTLGSSIPIRAEVQHQSHRPLQIYLETCVATTDSDISSAGQVHPVVSNSGCLVESKEGNSTFLPRREPAEIRLYLQAFKFALGENIFLHCDLTAWDIQSLSFNGKACQYLKEQNRWEMLDNPQSSMCACCESSCLRTDSLSGEIARKVLGPFIIVEDDSQRNSLNAQITEHGLSESPVWLLAVLVLVVLVTVMGVLAMSYYLCVWRGGRLGYRPSRDLLTKY